MNVSSTSSSSLGNTQMSGFGGLVSGLDRDSLIEQLTAGTQNKINEQKQQLTKNEWKQEAYRAVTDKVIDLEDNYLTFTAGDAIKNSSMYDKSVVTAQGDESATKFIKASGVSDMTSYMTINGVKQLATAATRISDSKGEATAVTTKANLAENIVGSNLSGKKLEFGTYDTTNKKFNTLASFTFPTSYKDGDETKTIDYLNTSGQALVDEINKALEQNPVKLGENGSLKFTYDAENDSIGIDQDALKDAAGYQIKNTSTALKGLGIDASAIEGAGDGISVEEFGANSRNFSEAAISNRSIENYLSDQSLSFTYGGETQSVSILTAEQSQEMAGKTYADSSEKLADIVKNLQSNINQKFGTGKIAVTANDDGSISFSNGTEGDSTSFTVTSDNSELLSNLGLSKNASNKLSMNASLYANMDKLGITAGSKEELDEQLKNFSINGKKIEGLTSDTTVSQMLSKINNAGAGVKATYMSGSGQFVLLATQTGSGRKIDLGENDSLANKIFGSTDEANNMDGKDAELTYSYGGNATQTVRSSTNTFNIDGLKVTASGTFGYTTDPTTGEMTDKIDSSKAVTFTAAANTDSVTEKVKKFIEAYNEIVKAVNTEITTKPESGYDPLTEAQEDEMTEKQVEKWNDKAKKGLLYNDSVIRDFSVSLNGVLSKFMQQGIDYKDMEDIGITMSDDVYDGGTLKFDESKFKAAMDSEPEKVSRIMAGDGSTKGLAKTIEDTLTPYATRYASRNGNSYGKLVEEAGSSKLQLSLQKNHIYTDNKTVNELITKLQERLKTEQNRYIQQFTTLETTIQNLNTQSGYLTSMMPS